MNLACEKFKVDPRSSFCNECGYDATDHFRPRKGPLGEPLNAPPPIQDDLEVAREILAKHYDYPTQMLDYKPCLDGIVVALSSARVAALKELNDCDKCDLCEDHHE